MGIKELRKKIRKVARVLDKKYPLSSIPQGLPPVDQMVFHFLAMNVPLTNAVKAYRALVNDYIDWNDVRVSRYAELARTLDEANVDTVLAFGVRQVLELAYAESNRAFLDALTDNEERTRKNLPRTKGMDSADVAYLGLVYQKDQTVPLDTHSDRILARMGFIKPKVLLTKRREEIQKLVPEREGLTYHYLFVEHGKKTCTVESPCCDRCVVSKECEYFRLAAKGSAKAKTGTRKSKSTTRASATGRSTTKATSRKVSGGTSRKATSRAKTARRTTAKK